MRIALIAPPLPSHIYTTCALGRELQRRGHSVAYFGVRDVQTLIEAEQVTFEPVAERTHPVGELFRFRDRLAALKGLAAIRLAVAEVVRMNRAFFAELPDRFGELGIDALVADQGEPAAGTVADRCRLPWVTVCNALPFNPDPDLPPTITPWGLRPDPIGRVRNRIAYFILERTMAAVTRGVAEQRRLWNLPPYTQWNDASSPYLQLAQIPESFDFPRRERPAALHYVGPLRRVPPGTAPFPWEVLDERPLVYASMGTLQNRQFWIFEAIAAACASLPVQLVISLGGGARPDEVGTLEGSPVVVEFAPQMELLRRSSLFVTHGGLNSVQEALLAEVPSIVIPITNDQPGVAARVARTGTGETLSLRRLSASRLRTLIERVLAEAGYRQRVARMKRAIDETGGVEEAAMLVEQVVLTRAPIAAAAERVLGPFGTAS
jgi:zeaxanthin glucosyltransferase